MLTGYIDGLGLVFQFGTLLAIAGGTFLGIIMGVLPGLTSAMAIALLLPVTFGMPPVMGIGVWCWCQWLDTRHIIEYSRDAILGRDDV